MDKDIENSIQFLNNKTKGKHGFDLPENYLDDLEQEMTLTTLGVHKTNPYTTPKAYFETIDDTILEKVKNNKTKVVSIKRNVYKLLSSMAAASILLFVAITYFNNNDEIINFDTITTADMESWYENGYIDAGNDLDLAINFDDLKFDEETLTTINTDNEQLEDYLHTIDGEILFNEIQ